MREGEDVTDYVPQGSELHGRPWWTALRDAYGIPELISDEHALAYLVQIANQDGEVPDVTTFDALDGQGLGVKTIGFVMTLAEEGLLDLSILNPKLDIGGLSTEEASRRHESSQAQLVVSTQALPLITRLRNHVRATIEAPPA
jgi:hypothetical protein